jgi:hypothetical protein
MRAILVSVQYSDILRLTLPYNRHHFSECWIVTSPADYPNVEPIARANSAKVVVTDLFYRSGARFNKFAALEHGLDIMGRHGLIAILDADVVWPSTLPPGAGPGAFQVGKLYGPRRRMVEPVPGQIPPEHTWSRYPLHPQQREYAGFSQIFHAEDPHLGPPPWHQTDWLHAGGGDSFFQAKWPESEKVRPPWEVLHLGPAGVNWMGRASAYVDGSVPEDGGRKITELRRLIRARTQGPDRFRAEKLS